MPLQNKHSASRWFSKPDQIFLSVLGCLIVVVLIRMGLRDLDTSTSLGPCDQETISKHLHCVGENSSTLTFSHFLESQGAKKEHPLYKAARERRQPQARGSPQGSESGSYDEEWYDPEVMGGSDPSPARFEPRQQHRRQG